MLNYQRVPSGYFTFIDGLPMKNGDFPWFLGYKKSQYHSIAWHTMRTQSPSVNIPTRGPTAHRPMGSPRIFAGWIEGASDECITKNRTSGEANLLEDSCWYHCFCVSIMSGQVLHLLYNILSMISGFGLVNFYPILSHPVISLLKSCSPEKVAITGSMAASVWWASLIWCRTRLVWHGNSGTTSRKKR